MKTRKALSVALVAIILAAGVLINPVAAQSGRALFNWVIADRVLVQSGGLTVTGSSALADTTVTGTESVSGALTAATLFNLTAQPVITMTADSTLTPTGSLTQIASAGAIGTAGGTKIAHTTDHLILVNIGAQTITFTETTGLNSAGNIVLGAKDTATLDWASGAWYQTAGSNN